MSVLSLWSLPQIFIIRGNLSHTNAQKSRWTLFSVATFSQKAISKYNRIYHLKACASESFFKSSLCIIYEVGSVIIVWISVLYVAYWKCLLWVAKEFTNRKTTIKFFPLACVVRWRPKEGLYQWSIHFFMGELLLAWHVSTMSSSESICEANLPSIFACLIFSVQTVVISLQLFLHYDLCFCMNRITHI